MPSQSTEDIHSPVTDDDTTFSRRSLGKRLLLGASALAVLLASSKREVIRAAPLTDDWHLGGNTAVSTDGTNFIGTKNVAPLVFKTAAANNAPLERMRITEAGNVGIGITAPGAKLQVNSTAYAVYGRHTATSGTQPGVFGDTVATVAGASGVQGVLRPTAPGSASAGVLGQALSTNANGAGVRGTHAGTGYGVHGNSAKGTGVYGDTSSNVANVSGVLGRLNATAAGADSAGVRGVNSGTNGNGAGVRGSHAGSGYGVHGTSAAYTGVRGDGGNTGVWGVGASYGVYGSGSANATGVYGESGTGAAVWGNNYYGGIAMKASGNAVQSAHSGGWAKAMLRMQGDGTFVSAYNGVTGASGSSAGFTITSQGGGNYVINFGSGIETQYRYFSLSGSSSIILIGFPSSTAVQIFVGNASYGYAYYILVF